MPRPPLDPDPLDPMDGSDGVRFAILDGRHRVALWTGPPPDPAVAHPAVAPVVATFDDGAGPRYAEAIPRGIRLADREPPDEDLVLYVVAGVLRGLVALHGAGAVHGEVVPRRILIGEAGEVVLYGRGRQEGSETADVLGALALLPPGADLPLPGTDAGEIAASLEARLPDSTRDRLATWVQAHTGRVDEVVPDLGEEHDATGLLDRYGTDPGLPPVEEAVDEDSSTQMNLHATLWRALAAPPSAPPPLDRFDAVDGQPSEGVAALLAEEIVHPLPTPALGTVDAFVTDTVFADEPDDPSSHTMKIPMVRIQAALDPDTARGRRGRPPRRLDGIPWDLVLLAALGGGALVGLLSWLLG